MKSGIKFGLILSIFCFTISIQAQNEDASSTAATKKSPTVKSSKTQGTQNKNQPSVKPSAKKTNAEAKNTISAKRPKITTGDIEVRADRENSIVTISRLENGIETEIATKIINNAGEIISFLSLDAGEYIVKIRKRGFFDDKKNVVLKAGKNTPLSFSLKPSAGNLNVSTNVDDAKIEIKNIGNFSGEFADLVPAPQTYEISVSADGYEPVTLPVSVNPGQEMPVKVTLKLSAPEKLLQLARNDFQLGKYRETLANSRLVLEQNADEPQANLLMGYAYFYSGHTRESRFYLARALALQAEIEIPVSLYQKEKKSEPLTEGVLKINRSTLNFVPTKNPDLNISFASTSVIDLQFVQNSLKGDSSNIDSIQLKVNLAAGKKTEKKTIQIFPRQAVAGAALPGKNINAVCGQCAGGVCRCQEEIRSLYEFLLNWKTGTFPRSLISFSSVVAPSANLVRFNFHNISLSIPENWQKASENDNAVWFSPAGGSIHTQRGTTQFGYAVSVGILPIKNNDLRLESENFYRTILSGNAYLDQQSSPKEIFIGGRKAVKAIFSGFEAERAEEEFVQIFTGFTGEGNLYYILTVSSFNKRREYRQTFNSIVNSVRF